MIGERKDHDQSYKTQENANEPSRVANQRYAPCHSLNCNLCQVTVRQDEECAEVRLHEEKMKHKADLIERFRGEEPSRDVEAGIVLRVLGVDYREKS